MRTVNIHEAKTHLSHLVEQAAKDEAFIIAKAGKPLVKVVPLGAQDSGSRGRLGFMEGEISVPDAFDTLGNTEIAEMFEGNAR